jgi:hypothetical protein
VQYLVDEMVSQLEQLWVPLMVWLMGISRVFYLALLSGQTWENELEFELEVVLEFWLGIWLAFCWVPQLEQ